MNFQAALQQIYQQQNQSTDRGQQATYIPELAKVELHKYGISFRNTSHTSFDLGDAHEKFSIQSISKVLTLALAFQLEGDNLWKRVDVEPSGNPFNHLSLLEQENGIPRNPLINAGSIVIADILLSRLSHPQHDFLQFVRQMTHDDTIEFDETVAYSEKTTGFRNYAAANLLKSFGNLHNPVEDVLDFYFHQCSLHMSCHQLTRTFYPFVNRGKTLQNHPILQPRQAKRINAIMLTCGFYDEAGEFAFEVGLPGKSGVGGGIVALLPGNYCISTWSPGLNPKGNSLLGMRTLEAFTTQTGLSIF